MKTKIKMLRMETTPCLNEMQIYWLTTIWDTTRICSSTREQVWEVPVSQTVPDVPIQQLYAQHRTFIRQATNNSKSKPLVYELIKLKDHCGVIPRMLTRLNLDFSIQKHMLLWARMAQTLLSQDTSNSREVNSKLRKKTSLMGRREIWEIS